MQQFSALYGIAFALFLAIDSLWLTTVANSFYKQKLGNLLLDKPLLAPAAVFYLVYIVAIIVFVVKPGFDQSLTTVAWKGALLGFAMYATYDLTNKSTLKDWPTSLTFVDLAWGTILTATVSLLTVILYTKFVS